jgi:flagellar basal body rod protein FlgG
MNTSGMRTAMTRHDICAHDIANVNTRGYQEKTPVQTGTSPRGARISHIVTRANDPRALSNVDLARETGERIQNGAAMSANAAAVRVQNRMVGEVIDLIG